MAFCLLTYISTRGAAGFFTKHTSEELWKSVTTISNTGKKRGRKRRQFPELNRGQRFGDGQVQTYWPGLNKPISASSDTMPRILPSNPNREADLIANRTEQARRNKRRLTKAYHPLERGWAGKRVLGRKLGPPKPQGDETFPGFESVCLELKSVSHGDSTYGKVRRFSSLMVTGNGEGLAGFSWAKTSEVDSAVDLARNRAAKRLSYIERMENRTIYQDFYAECNRTRIYASRVPEGHGLKCHRALKDVCRLIGITDLHVRVEGNTRNYIALLKAFFTGLRNQETFQQLAERKRLHVVEFSKEVGYTPRIVASPKWASVRKREELEKNEVLDLDELYGGSRVPLERKPKHPYYVGSESWNRARWKEHPYRNIEQTKLRLIAEGYVNQWTKAERLAWTQREEEKTKRGERPIPEGIGLPDLKRTTWETTKE